MIGANAWQEAFGKRAGSDEAQEKLAADPRLEHLAVAAVIASWRQRGVDFMGYCRTAAAWDGTGWFPVAALIAFNIEGA
ncbi:hypothetical protein C9417_06565 [Rhizobium sp. SEMIA 4088]|nr:hypothetical protein C9417_06565 [Rhizobium sp. SEMIA 4088]